MEETVNDVTLRLFHIYVSRGDVSIILKSLNTDYKIVAPWASAWLRKLYNRYS